MKDYIYIGIVVILFFVFLFLHIRQTKKLDRLLKRYDRFMRGKNAENLSEALEENFYQMEQLTLSHQQTELNMTDALRGIKSTLHKVGIVKYDAFKEMGGNLSFALCILDDDNTGFILNTMHGRESSYTYIKEIIKGEAYATLGEEEKEALEKALNS